MSSDGLTELAKLFKERDKKTPPSITIGTVIKPPPEVEIRLNEIIVLKKDKLIFSAHMLSGYKRRFKFTNIEDMAEWTDTIVEGDEVIIIPTVDNELFVVIDKVVRY